MHLVHKYMVLMFFFFFSYYKLVCGLQCATDWKPLQQNLSVRLRESLSSFYSLSSSA